MTGESILKAYEIASVALTMLVIILSIVTVILKKSNNKKAQAIADKIKKATEAIITVKSVIQTFMVEAEQFINYSGLDKKSWVITKTKEYCIKNSIAYDDALIESTLESLIQFSKRVNASDEKKEEVAEEEATQEKKSTEPKENTIAAVGEREIKVNG